MKEHLTFLCYVSYSFLVHVSIPNDKLTFSSLAVSVPLVLTSKNPTFCPQSSYMFCMYLRKKH